MHNRGVVVAVIRAIVNDNHAIIDVIADHHAAMQIITDHNVMVNVISAVDHDRPLADNNVARNIRGNDYRLRDHHRLRSRGDDDLVEQRLAPPEAVEVQTNQAAPMAFEDHELLRVVVAPVLADFVAALVDDAELFAILQHGRIIELHFNVQVFLRPCLCRRGRPRVGLVKPRYSDVMPGHAGAWICGLCDSHATQHYCY
jgi:hypothetical protein